MSALHIYLAPHFDDATYACGGWIASQIQGADKALVITIFGGAPSRNAISPLAQLLHGQWGLSWDAAKIRAEQDRHAMTILGASHEHWDFLDAIYRRRALGEYVYNAYERLFGSIHPEDNPLIWQIAGKLKEIRSRSKDSVIFYSPLAVGNHVDHQIVRQAAEKIRQEGNDVLFYEDQPYVDNDFKCIGQALSSESKTWWKPTKIAVLSEKKEKAIACYTPIDQSHVLKKIDGYSQALSRKARKAERFWSLTPREALDAGQRARLLICPLCRSSLQQGTEQWACIKCGKKYPVHFGIPDLRVGYLPDAKDFECAKKLFEIYPSTNYEDLVKACVRFNTESSQLADHYLDYHVAHEKRRPELLGNLLYPWSTVQVSCAMDKGLDVGCGFGGGSSGLAAISSSVISVDVSLSGLLCAKKLLEERGLSPFSLLIAASAKALPFADCAFSHVIARDVYEHVPGPKQFLQETHRVLRPGGALSFNTTSRFTWTEPHVLLKGVGYLPRAFQPAWVRLLRHRDYEIWLPSLCELKRIIRQALPPENPWSIKTFPRIKMDQVPETWQGRFIRRLPILTRWINNMYSHLGPFEVLVGK